MSVDTMYQCEGGGRVEEGEEKIKKIGCQKEIELTE